MAEKRDTAGPAPIPAATPAPTDTRCGFVAVIGAPNAGKSTLVNALVGSKVTIVSRKAQTTRTTIRGIANEGSSQLVFIDTPGIFAPRRRLDRAMVGAAWGGVADADVVVLVIDAAKGLSEDCERVLDRLAGIKATRLLALNKVDRLAGKEALLSLTARIVDRAAFDAVFMVSALKGSGVADLKSRLATLVPPGPWHFAEDDVTDLPLRLFAAEIVREKIYDRLHDELPYAAMVETTSWQERKDGSVRIEATILVERDSQRPIVLGKGGSAIKQISMEARSELATMLERAVHLFLTVKVSEGWAEERERYREMGLDFPED